MVESSFPIVSFAPFLSGSEDGQRKVASGLYNAFHTYGWVYLKDFGISQEEIDEMFAVVCSSHEPRILLISSQ
jgi:isopenicillin N synthase-like dioxygenase